MKYIFGLMMAILSIIVAIMAFLWDFKPSSFERRLCWLDDKLHWTDIM